MKNPDKNMFYNIFFFQSASKSGGDKHVDHHANDVVGDGDEGAGCQGRVDF